jgi:site-specific DNA-cytosine methylase
MRVNEMMRLQGMDPRQLDLSCINSEKQFAKMVGNSMAVNVLERILSSALPAAGLPAAGSAVRKRKRDDESPA